MANAPIQQVWRVDHGHPEVHYQPIIDLRTGTVTGVEALARWRMPEGRLLPPAAFIASAEATGAIGWLGRQVRDRAMADVAALSAGAPRDLVLHVNVSPREVDQVLPASLEAALAAGALAPHQLVVEITESGPLLEHGDAVQVLHEVADLDVRIALDDFGTGWSCTDRLRQVPTHVLKVDRSDVAGVGDHIARFRVQAILGYARRNGLEVVAEGIETAEQLAWLQAHHCEHGQGYLFSPPVPLDEVAALVPGQDDEPVSAGAS